MMTNHVGKRISKRQKGKMYEEEGKRISENKMITVVRIYIF